MVGAPYEMTKCQQNQQTLKWGLDALLQPPLIIS